MVKVILSTLWVVLVLFLVSELLRQKEIFMLSRFGSVLENLGIIGISRKIEYNKKKILKECPSLNKNGYKDLQEIRNKQVCNLLKKVREINDMGNIQTKDLGGFKTT